MLPCCCLVSSVMFRRLLRGLINRTARAEEKICMRAIIQLPMLQKIRCQATM